MKTRMQFLPLLMLACTLAGCGDTGKSEPASTTEAQPARTVPPQAAADEPTAATPAAADPAEAQATAVADQDGDGITDAADQCPDTPPGVTVTADGCMRDTDGDGIADSRDACPATPRGQTVDERGCVPRLKAPEEFQIAVTFSSSSASVDGDEARAALAGVMRLMRTYPNTRAQVYAYTDSSGAAAANQKLSQARAESIAAVMVNNGIPASRIAAVGKGEADPVASNDTRAGRAKNRRVMVLVVPG